MAKTRNLVFGGTDNFLVTRAFNKVASREQKLQLMDCLFAVTAAEDGISTVEDNEIRQISKELLFEHRDYIAVRLRHRGRRVRLVNPDAAVRGLELTLEPAGGPVQVLDVRTRRRARGFAAEVHQAHPTGPAKVVLVSLSGEVIRPGRGTVLALKLRRPAGRGRLRLTEVRVADQ